MARAYAFLRRLLNRGTNRQHKLNSVPPNLATKARVEALEGRFFLSVPQVNSIVPNNTSMLNEVTVTFNEPVTLASNAIKLMQQSTSGGTPTPMAYNLSTPDGGTTYNLTFSDSPDLGGSLPDGDYELTVSAAGVTDGSSNHPTSDQTVPFYRLFGDINGDGIVNGSDFLAFRTAYLSFTGDSNYNPAFDYNSDGAINGSDYLRFRSNFLVSPEPAVWLNTIPAATQGVPLTISSNAVGMGTDFSGDSLSYSWSVFKNGNPYTLPIAPRL
jgi:hypothetical protein